MRPDTILYMEMPNGTFRVWIDGHVGTTTTGNSFEESLGLLVINHQQQIGVIIRRKESL